jgi:integrase
MARKTLTDKGVVALKPRAAMYAHADPYLPGHYVRIMPSGTKSFVVIARDPRGKQIWSTIGNAALMDIEAARKKARVIIAAIKAGEDRAGPQSFQAIAEQWLKRHVEKNGLRSRGEIHRLLTSHVLPAWQGRNFTSIKRSDVTALLDHVEDKHGARQADYVLAIVRGICNWYASRHDDYATPIVKGMGRRSIKASERKRILSDDEIRAVWEAASGTFGDLVKLLLLTGQRLDKVASMRWDDINVDGVWTIATEEREKGNGGDLVLPAVAVGIIRAHPRLGDNPHVFAGRGDSHFSGYSKAKRALDVRVPLPQWQLHDLRRTARSLMSRAGIRPDVAERVLGHTIEGVEGVYDRHSYREEKADALKRLAVLVRAIINPRPDNVVHIDEPRRA